MGFPLCAAESSLAPSRSFAIGPSPGGGDAGAATCGSGALTGAEAEGAPLGTDGGDAEAARLSTEASVGATADEVGRAEPEPLALGSPPRQLAIARGMASARVVRRIER